MRDAMSLAVVACAAAAAACGPAGGPMDASDADAHRHAHCGAPYAADPRDETMTGAYQVYDTGARDLGVPAEVAAWLEEQGWPQQHDDWHRVRRWDQRCRRSFAAPEGPDGALGTADDCAAAAALRAEGLWRAAIQEGAPGDGYDFLVMHRHMLEGVRAAFPRHPELFRAWTRVPRTQDDPENLTPWRAVRWSDAQLRAIETLENIEAHVAEFATEDELALFMEAPFRWTEDNPSTFVNDGRHGIHFALHAQWSVPGSPVLLGDGVNVVLNANFWRLHAWLDEVWERYRRARGITAEDPAYRRAMRTQCEEMHALDARTRAAYGGAR